MKLSCLFFLELAILSGVIAVNRDCDPCYQYSNSKNTCKDEENEEKDEDCKFQNGNPKFCYTDGYKNTDYPCPVTELKAIMPSTPTPESLTKRWDNVASNILTVSTVSGNSYRMTDFVF